MHFNSLPPNKVYIRFRPMSLPPQKRIYTRRTHTKPNPCVLLTHVWSSAPLYQFGCCSDLVMVTKEPLSGFPGLWGSQEPYSDKYKIGGEGQNFTVILGLWGTFSNIQVILKELDINHKMINWIGCIGVVKLKFGNVKN